MRTVITSASSGINGDRTSWSTVIVDFDSESVGSGNIRYSSYGCKTDAQPDPVDVKRNLEICCCASKYRAGAIEIARVPIQFPEMPLLDCALIQSEYRVVKMVAFSSGERV